MVISRLKRIGNVKWEIPPASVKGMKVPARIFADEQMIGRVEESSIRQLVNAATLPGVLQQTLGMPDIHQGYGLPIGGVMATDPDEGIVSPGAAGYDINCGVRLMTTPLERERVLPRADETADELARSIPHGVGRGGLINLSSRDYEKLAEAGARWAVDKGFGSPEDLESTEEGGCIKGGDPASTSKEARRRGHDQIGTIGSGNHFCEIQWVDEIYEKEIAEKFGLYKNQVVVMIHTGSRGFGHQIATDYIGQMGHAMKKYGISVPDNELACAPVDSPEGRDYISAMAVAANYAWANRQVIMHLVRLALIRMFGGMSMESMKLVYDVAHNIIKEEEHSIGGKKRKVMVHRKGATRAFPAAHPDLAEKYRETGQPVIVPGDMGRMSFILAGRPASMEESIGSSCHGAGRLMSRHAAIKKARSSGMRIRDELAGRGISVRAAGKRTLMEEMPLAYKDVSEVVNVVSKAGLAVIVARMRPIAVIKG